MAPAVPPYVCPIKLLKNTRFCKDSAIYLNTYGNVLIKSSFQTNVIWCPLVCPPYVCSIKLLENHRFVCKHSGIYKDDILQLFGQK